MIERRARELLVMDLRGTGRSGVLRCRALERTGIASVADAAAECASALGARRGFYTARDSAEDVESVRRALGVEKIALFGVSYGARVALTYAQRYPDRVDRLLLQSPPPPEGEDLLYRSALAAVPAVVKARCGRRGCRRASRSPAADVVALAKQLERGPIPGSVVDGDGSRRSLHLRGRDLFEALGGTGFPSFSFPDSGSLLGLIRNARRGDVAPLLRARQTTIRYRRILPSSDAPRRFSAAAYAASICEESVLPWPRTTPLEGRYATALALAFALPPGAFGPFGPRTALESDRVHLCSRWPVASAPPDPPRVLPAIPTLILAGEQDLAAPVAHAEAVARLIPGARVMRVVGPDSELDLSSGSCPLSAVEAFLGRSPRGKCYQPRKRWPALPPPPLSLADLDPEPGASGRAGRTMAAVRLTLRDGAGHLALRFFVRVLTPGVGRRQLYRSPVRAGALRRGTYRLGFRRPGFELRDASYVPGVRVSGLVRPRERHGGARPRGHLRVGGPAAARGRLVLRGRVLSGRLGGRPVRMRIGAAAYPDISFGR